MSWPAKPIALPVLRAYILAGGTPKGFASDFAVSSAHIWKKLSLAGLRKVYLTRTEERQILAQRKQQRINPKAP